MLISDIIPYGRNARRNEAAIPKVAESIREFGFKGSIVLRSREDPTIVCGHTRVAACKSLGWTEIPDENIAYCDGLTDEQIRAFRIADNKTGEVATWNRTLLQHEVKGIKKLDMSRFGCEFKAKKLTYGAERLRTDRAYNLDLVNRCDCDGGGFPPLDGVDEMPRELIGFNYAKSTDAKAKRGNGCHFFIDDYQFERVWANPAKYLDVLKPFGCVLTPDFSLYMDMPAPMQAWNRYRSQALGRYWQDSGLTVVPTLSWAQPESYAFCFEGMPRHSTVATSTVGVKGDADALAVWMDGMREAMRRVEPSPERAQAFAKVNPVYWSAVLDDLRDHGYVKVDRLAFVDGERYLNIRITSEDVEFLRESPKMRRAREFLDSAFDAVLRVAMEAGKAL